MILAIDIGNTNIVVGCCKDNKVSFVERISTNHTATELEYAVSIKTILELYNIDFSEWKKLKKGEEMLKINFNGFAEINNKK